MLQKIRLEFVVKKARKIIYNIKQKNMTYTKKLI